MINSFISVKILMTIDKMEVRQLFLYTDVPQEDREAPAAIFTLGEFLDSLFAIHYLYRAIYMIMQEVI